MESPIKILKKNNSLISTTIEEIKIFTNKNHLLCVDLIISGFAKSSEFKLINLKFENVIEYSLYFNDDYNFYNVESFKFFKNESFYYLSLDPDDSVNEISDNDLDLIKSKNVILKVLE